jgi:hypothetical protein
VSAYSLVLAFDTDDTEFARGVELGCLWERLKHEPGPVEEMIHVTNSEMAMRVAEALGRSFIGHHHDDAWVTVKFGEEPS